MSTRIAVKAGTNLLVYTARLLVIGAACGAACGAVFSASAAGQSAEATVQKLLSNPKVKTAQEFVSNDHARIVKDTIAITEIEAPSFKESRRAKAYLQMLRENHLTDVEMDAEGNVMGLRKGSGGGPFLAVAAHLDTVFPEGTNVKVKQDGTTLSAPGIGDDSWGLAVLLAIVRAMDAAGIQTKGDILFVGDVGEEGAGDIRGVKYLFQKGRYKDKIQMFISLDGPGSGSEITAAGVGSKRYQVTFRGPGGHSYSAFGLVNPAYALAGAIEKFSKMRLPADSKTTFNVGMLGGGTSVNSIPFEAWMEVDMRSESAGALDAMVQTFSGLMRQAAAEENSARSTSEGKISVDLKLIGDRPVGTTPSGSPIVQMASAVIQHFGLYPHLNSGSTDSNLPISMKIPAITIESGGHGDRYHSLDEWIDVEKTSAVRGINIAMGIVLALADIN